MGRGPAVVLGILVALGVLAYVTLSGGGPGAPVPSSAGPGPAAPGGPGATPPATATVPRPGPPRAPVTSIERATYPSPDAPSPEGPTKYQDPICGMMVEEGKGLTKVHLGVTYHFCSEACLAKFLEAPPMPLEPPEPGKPPPPQMPPPPHEGQPPR